MFKKKSAPLSSESQVALNELLETVESKKALLKPLPSKTNPSLNDMTDAEQDMFTQAEEKKIDKLTRVIDKLSVILDRSHFSEYVTSQQRPVRLLFTNLFIGIFRGFGFAVGATVILSFSIYLTSIVLTIPIVSKTLSTIIIFFKSVLTL